MVNSPCGRKVAAGCDIGFVHFLDIEKRCHGAQHGFAKRDRHHAGAKTSIPQPDNQSGESDKQVPIHGSLCDLTVRPSKKSLV